ncbi:RimJ/RimL family protein N-acetyltransferase [Crossiella equi]|uniref:RimJ/RimL family protein N-acetyltransferase n=1 Tax=Crossiella equi TaxID=130796 RepID=A0ABS5A9M2_9PSEU|nr:GNAT family N-acetyltransferase [Crossiella equi]MBP2472914.1 RimJ/RimL family protein N-acetyltransferase [Crossiella equi]
MSLPVLRTDRLVLRPLTAADQEPLVAVFAGEGADPAPHTSVDLADPHALRALLTMNLIEYRADGLGHFVFELDGTVIGFGHLAGFGQFPPPFVSTGWAVGGAYRGKGLATEAVRAMVTHAHDTVGVPGVWALIHPDNTPSKRVAERSGFVHVGWREKLGRQVEVHVALRPVRDNRFGFGAFGGEFW